MQPQILRQSWNVLILVHPCKALCNFVLKSALVLVGLVLVLLVLAEGQTHCHWPYNAKDQSNFIPCKSTVLAFRHWAAFKGIHGSPPPPMPYPVPIICPWEKPLQLQQSTYQPSGGGHQASSSLCFTRSADNCHCATFRQVLMIDNINYKK